MPEDRRDWRSISRDACHLFMERDAIVDGTMQQGCRNREGGREEGNPAIKVRE
jgi:hypothetical protein